MHPIYRVFAACHLAQLHTGHGIPYDMAIPSPCAITGTSPWPSPWAWPALRSGHLTGHHFSITVVTGRYPQKYRNCGKPLESTETPPLIPEVLKLASPALQPATASNSPVQKPVDIELSPLELTVENSLFCGKPTEPLCLLASGDVIAICDSTSGRVYK